MRLNSLGKIIGVLCLTLWGTTVWGREVTLRYSTYEIASDTSFYIGWAIAGALILSTLIAWVRGYRAHAEAVRAASESNEAPPEQRGLHLRWFAPIFSFTMFSVLMWPGVIRPSERGMAQARAMDEALEHAPIGQAVLANEALTALDEHLSTALAPALLELRREEEDAIANLRERSDAFPELTFYQFEDARDEHPEISRLLEEAALKREHAALLNLRGERGDSVRVELHRILQQLQANLQSEQPVPPARRREIRDLVRSADRLVAQGVLPDAPLHTSIAQRAIYDEVRGSSQSP